MASTYSSLKVELIGTGEQAGTWGATTNTNLGTALEEAIVGSADVSFSGSDVTLTLTDTNATQIARHIRLNLTGTSGGARNLILGAGCQIEKPYLINNTLADAVTVKNTTGTGITVPAGKTMWVYNDATNVVDAVTHLSSLTLGAGLPVASGGTGQTSYTDGQLLIGNSTGNTLTKATLTAGSGITVTNGSGSITIAATGGGTVTSVGGTGTVNGITLTGTVTSSGNLTLGGALTGVNLATQVTGTLPVANGGTGVTTLTGLVKGNGSSAFSAATAGTDYVAASSATTFTAKQTFIGSGSAAAAEFRNIIEDGTVSGSSITGTVNFDLLSQSVIYYTANASGNWTLNVRGDSDTSLDSLMDVGDSVTIAVLVTNGATAYYQTALQIDGSGITPK